MILILILNYNNYIKIKRHNKFLDKVYHILCCLLALILQVLNSHFLIHLSNSLNNNNNFNKLWVLHQLNNHNNSKHHNNKCLLNNQYSNHKIILETQLLRKSKKIDQTIEKCV